MNSIFKKPSTSTKRGRNGFDLSFRRLFTAPCGMMLPVAFDFTQPGDKYKLNAQMFIRTQPVQTAAFTRFRIHCDWHYVPIRQLYAFWNEFYNSVFDGHTNFVKKTDGFSLPVFPIAGVNRPASSPEKFSFFGASTNNGASWRCNLDNFAVPYQHNFRRLFDLFGYGTVGRYGSDSNFTMTVPLFPYLAYHKIFYSHYNNSTWFRNDPSYYNVDSYHGATIPDAVALPIISTIHYAPWRNDYFRNILPSPTFNSAYANSLGPSGAGSNYMSLINRESPSNDLSLNNSGDASVGSNINLGLNIAKGENLTISTSDIRSLFALDRLTRVTGLAGSHYDEQIAAHFGIKLNKILANESQFIGSQSIEMGISEVVASATTDSKEAGSTLGDIAGKGYATGAGKDIDFTATEHGIIMAIFYIEPYLDYSTQGIDPKLRYKNTLDFYHPELDDIGMQPFDSNVISVRKLTSPVITGWQYRYSELKTNWDKVNEGFYEVGVNRTWQTNFQQSLDDANFTNMGTFATFYIAPQYTNNIFYSDFIRYIPTGVWSESTQNSCIYNTSEGNNWSNPFNKASNVYSGDNFFCCIDFKMFKTSIMSVHSLPRL